MSNIFEAPAHAAVDQIKGTVGSARSGILDFGTQALKLLNSIRAQEHRLVGSALEHIGLQRRESSLRPVMWFGAGAVVAGTAVLLVIPSSRERILSAVRDILRPSDATPAVAKPSEPANVVVDKAPIGRDKVAEGVS